MKTLILATLLLLAVPASAQKVLGNFGGSDSLAVACDSNWMGNVYTMTAKANESNVHGYVWVRNLGSAGDLLVAQNNDTTAMVGAFSVAVRVEPGGDRVFPLYCKTLRFKAARKGTTVPFWFSVVK